MYIVHLLSGEGISYCKKDLQVFYGITDEQHIIYTGGRANKVDVDMTPCSACSMEFDGRVYEVFIFSCGFDLTLSHTLLCSEWVNDLSVDSHLKSGVFKQANIGVPVLNRCVDEYPDGQWILPHHIKSLLGVQGHNKYGFVCISTFHRGFYSYQWELTYIVLADGK